MKKLLLVLALIAMASFLFVGCLGEGTTTDTDTDTDTDVDAVTMTVEIADSVVLDGKTYVSDEAHLITVTFAEAVVGNVDVNVSTCAGDYKAIGDIVMFPDATNKIWTGSAAFGGGELACCASYVEVSSGDCGAECVTKFPVIVDSSHPTATILVDVDTCTCDGCEYTFESGVTEDVCEDDVIDCNDDCSGLASWSIKVYDEDPFDTCCLTECVEPIGTCSGTDCPIECVSACLDDTVLFAVATLVDQVGNESKAFAKLTGMDPDTCSVVTVTQYAANDLGCTDWTGAVDSSEAVIIEEKP